MLTQCLEIKARGCCRHVFLVMFILIHLVNFPYGRKAEYQEKLTAFGRVLTDSFHMRTGRRESRTHGLIGERPLQLDLLQYKVGLEAMYGMHLSRYLKKRPTHGL